MDTYFGKYNVVNTNSDKYLDPPDKPTHGPCDGCGEIFDNDDLTQVDGQWLCRFCEEDKQREEDKSE